MNASRPSWSVCVLVEMEPMTYAVSCGIAFVVVAHTVEKLQHEHAEQGRVPCTCQLWVLDMYRFKTY